MRRILERLDDVAKGWASGTLIRPIRGWHAVMMLVPSCVTLLYFQTTYAYAWFGMSLFLFVLLFERAGFRFLLEERDEQILVLRALLGVSKQEVSPPLLERVIENDES